MLNYQSLSFHDVLSLRHLMSLQPAPEFAMWLTRMALLDERGRLPPPALSNALLTSMSGGS
jgi:ethanolamine ammonia-lyase large subunit